MKISRIDHLGIAVQSIDEVLPYFENTLGLKCYAIEEVADQKVKTAFLKVGEVKLELLEPTSPESAVAKFLERAAEVFTTWLSLLRTVSPMLWQSATSRASV